MHTFLLLYIIITIIIITADNYLANQMWFSMVCTLIDNDTHHHMIMIMIHIITNYVVDTGGTRVKLSCNIINVTVPLGVVIATTITRQQETMFGVMGGTPLRIRRDRRLHSVSKNLNLSPQRSYRPALDRTNCRPVQKQINAI